MATNPGEVKLKKKRKRKAIPEVIYQLRVIRVHEAVCPDCSEVVKESTEGYKDLLGKHTCEDCGAKFKVIEIPTKEDGRGRVVNKDLARDVILRRIQRNGPVSAKRLREHASLNKVATKRIIDSLNEEGLIKHISKGWVQAE